MTAEDRDVHDDADDRPPQRHHEGDQRRDGENGVARDAVRVPPTQERRQRVVVRHRRHQAAHRHGVADEVREDGADQRKADDDPARLPEEPAGHVKRMVVGLASGVGQIGHGARPAGRGGVTERENRDGGQKRVGDDRRDERREHDPEGLADGEPEFRGRIRDGLETHEEPRRDGEDVQDLEKAMSAIGGENRVHRCKSAAVVQRRRREADENAGGKYDRHHRLHDARKATAAADGGGDGNGGDGEQDVAEVDVVFLDRVAEPEAEDVAQRVARHDHQRRHV